MDLRLLKEELDNDPVRLGYRIGDANNAMCARILNDKSLRKVPNTEPIACSEIYDRMDSIEYQAALGDSRKAEMLLHILAMVFIFGVESATIAALTGLRDWGFWRLGSRGEELGLGEVSPSDVTDARRLS